MAGKDGKAGKGAKEQAEGEARPRLKRAAYEERLAELQLELVKLQYWVKQEGLKVVLIFEGRDAAGKGGTIKRLTEPLNPRGATVVALPAPSDRERTEWYFQRLSGSCARSWKRCSCSASLTENQYLSRMIPERTSIRSNSGQARSHSRYSSSVQNPSTRSTPPRLYQERSKITISPAAGRCST